MCAVGLVKHGVNSQVCGRVPRVGQEASHAA